MRICCREKNQDIYNEMNDYFRSNGLSYVIQETGTGITEVRFNINHEVILMSNVFCKGILSICFREQEALADSSRYFPGINRDRGCHFPITSHCSFYLLVILILNTNKGSI